MLKAKSKISKNTTKKISLGDHICSIYQTKEQQFVLVVPFLGAGLIANEKCIYIIDENSKEEIISQFIKRGIEIKKYIESGQFLILTKEQSYLKDGSFDPDRMINLLKETEKKALEEGYSGVRASGEMSWVLKNISDIEKLNIYESKLNSFITPGEKIAAICQYNENKFSPEVLINVLKTHPNAIIFGSLFENPFYSSIKNIKIAAQPSFFFNEYNKMKEALMKKKIN